MKVPHGESAVQSDSSFCSPMASIALFTYLKISMLIDLAGDVVSDCDGGIAVVAFFWVFV